MSLQDIRNSIDVVDHELVCLLSKRMDLAVQTIGLKEGAIHDLVREKEVLERVANLQSGLVSSAFLLEIFKLILAESRRLQESVHKVSS